MQIAFRADASIQIGTGHIMRCLSLADELSKQGAQCSFICRPHEGHLLELIAQHKHKCLPLPILHKRKTSNLSGTAHAEWLGVDWTEDASDTREAIVNSMGSERLDWLVVDHYAIDSHWEKILRPTVRRIMAIDDLADRAHDCDLLLDQNLGRTPQAYGGLLGSETALMAGSQYTLLRSEFSQVRARSLARRTASPQFRHLLISLGGIDKDNVTSDVLTAIMDCPFPVDLRITVVMGPKSPWIEHVQTQAKRMPRATQVLVGVTHMAELMADSDLAIGAVGGTAWERCCVGLPSVLLALAENQQAGARALQSVGAGMALQSHHLIPSLLSEWILTETIIPVLAQMSKAAAGVTDGLGCLRVSSQLLDSCHA